MIEMHFFSLLVMVDDGLARLMGRVEREDEGCGKEEDMHSIPCVGVCW